VLLFGSSATGKAHRHSDIDLAFSFDRDIDILALTNDVIRLLHNDNVDVIDLRHVSPLLRFSAARNGRLLYERSQGEFNAFFSLAFRRYVDTKKLRDMQAAAIK
jgi:predicted nucleotidyltransferase